MVRERFSPIPGFAAKHPHDSTWRPMWALNGFSWTKNRLDSTGWRIRRFGDTAAELTGGMPVEIGPGLHLTSRLLAFKNSVTAGVWRGFGLKINRAISGKKLTVVNHIILQFDLNQLPKNYRRTSRTLPRLLKIDDCENKPSTRCCWKKKLPSESRQRLKYEHSVCENRFFAEAELDIEVLGSLRHRQKLTPCCGFEGLRNSPLTPGRSERFFPHC